MMRSPVPRSALKSWTVDWPCASTSRLLRPLSMAELSDGTLRFLLLAAALHTPRPPPLLVLNEPETSLHPTCCRRWRG